MFAALGAGTLSQDRLNSRLANLINSKLRKVSGSTIPIADFQSSTKSIDAGIRVLGASGIAVNVAKCCSPLPGDIIVGYITHSRGVTVHRTKCRNLASRADSARLVDCDWANSEQMYAARIVAEAWDRPGLISDLTTVLALASINLGEISSGKHQDRKVFISLTLETIGGEEFTSILSRLEQVRGIITIQRKD